MASLCHEEKKQGQPLGLPLAQFEAEEEEEDPLSPLPGGCGIAMQQMLGLCAVS